MLSVWHVIVPREILELPVLERIGGHTRVELRDLQHTCAKKPDVLSNIAMCHKILLIFTRTFKDKANMTEASE